MDDRYQALEDLGAALRAGGYAFVSPTPETHRRVLARFAQAGADARTLRDVFGWSRPFAGDVLPPHLFELARRADVLAIEGDRYRARVRFSTLRGRIFVHSPFPTTATDAVFFGPDTYRFCDLLAAELRGRRVRRAVDVGCGAGAGGVVVAEQAESVVLGDVNEAALAFAAVNARLAGVDASVVASDVLRAVDGEIDLVVANPPYLADPRRRTYRDGGGDFGEALSARIVRESLERVTPGGRLILYSGAAIIAGNDKLLDAVRADLDGNEWRYRELDPDVFGEEIARNDLYAAVERIAAVALVVTKRRPARPLHHRTA